MEISRIILMAEYFYSKDQKQKSKEFFNQIVSLERLKFRYKKTS
jgi:hypothetical protein